MLKATTNEMTLERLLRLCSDAASPHAEFQEHYDFAGEVGPEPVLKLMINIEELIGAIEDVLVNCALDDAARVKLGTVTDRVRGSWPKEPKVDRKAFKLSLSEDGK